VLAGDTVQRRDIKLGRVVDDMRVVTDGLKPGDAVIVDNLVRMRPGAAVTPVKKS